MWVDNRPEPKLKSGEWYHMETLVSGKGAIQQQRLRKVKAIKRYGDIWLFEDEKRMEGVLVALGDSEDDLMGLGFVLLLVAFVIIVLAIIGGDDE